MTKKQLQDELDALGVEYSPRATKPVLKALWEQNRQADETEPVDAPAVEPVAEVEEAPAVRPPAPAGAGPIQGNGPVTRTVDRDCPPMDPALGDKTPAVVAWRRENWDPVKFEMTYAGRTLD